MNILPFRNKLPALIVVYEIKPATISTNISDSASNLQSKVGGELLEAKRCQLRPVSVWRLLPHLCARLCVTRDAK